MELPARVSKYELQEFLGGGMSHVYRARDTVIGRTVAVKILTEAGCQDAEAKARFLAEARMAGNISHDNIISIYDFGEDEKQHPFMVMEFLRGEDLRHAIKNGHTGDLRSKLRIALQIARALEYIHTQKIVHRDIKPENIHVNGAGVVKLMDFGIAKTEGLAMTRAGYVLGTPYYMSPEQVTGQNITEQVDVYAFGVLLFELLTGVKPIAGDTVERIFYSILNEPLKLEPLYQAGVPQAVCDLVAKCTNKSPADRPQGFAPVCAELEQMIATPDAATVLMPERRDPVPQAPPAPPVLPAPAPPAPAPPAPAPRPAPASRGWLVPALVAAVLVAGGGLYFALRPHAAAGPATPVVPVVTAPAAPKTIATPTGDMILIPAGNFEFGESKQPVSLPAFYIDKTEVSNAAYAEFCKASGRPLPKGFAADKPDYPVGNVTILDAHAFAKWAGKRLPSDQEWEKAARGEDGRTFPWGNQNDPARANVGTHKQQPVNAYADGASPYGVLQMVGNVWELIEKRMAPSDEAMENFRIKLDPAPRADEPWYQIRGESYDDPLAQNVIWDSTTVPARWKEPNIGFRCAKDAQP
ncbi:MAG: bifunctional serine/threonine-protein kinase/formylglycine-generating enzyme family protein [Bryobacteraceae bacterium]